jgi:hypothetical protein
MDMHERIKARRTQLELSFVKLSEAIFKATGKRIAWQTIQLWEKEDGTAPNRSNLAAAAAGLRCSTEWLVTGRGTADDPAELPAPNTVPEAPPVARMVLQYNTPEECELLEQFRLSYEDGREEIKLMASTTKKRPLARVVGVDDTQV